MSFPINSLSCNSSAVLAVDDFGRVMTRTDIELEAHRWKEALGSQRRFVILLAENTVPSLKAYLGLVTAGHAVYLCSSASSAETLAALRKCYSPAAIIAGADDAIIVERLDSFAELYHDLSVLLSTSGSTGSPKLARFTWNQLEANARAIISYLTIHSCERAFLHLPFHYSYGLSIVHSHLLAGARILLSRHSIMEKSFWTRLEEEEATSLSGVPFHYESMLRLHFEKFRMPRLKTLTQAGGRLPQRSVERVADISSDRGWRFFVMYGQTEAGPRISYLPPDLVRKHSTSIGYPIPGVRMSIVDDDGKLITENGVSGELVVESPSIMLGYAMGHADLALGDELSGRLATGDLTMRDAKGFFQITGRKKRFIKLHGNRVGLDEVEMRLASLGHNVTCVGEDDILWIVLQADGDPDATRTVALQQFSLPARSIRALRAPVPLTAAGKPRYDELLDALKAGLSC